MSELFDRADRRRSPATLPAFHTVRSPGNSNLGITSICLKGIDNAEIIDTVHSRRAPTVPVSATLRR